MDKANIKQHVINKLTRPYARVSLLCDGYNVDLIVAPKAKSSLAYEVRMFINDQIEFKWMDAREKHAEQKFLKHCKKFVFSPKERAMLTAENKRGKKFGLAQNNPNVTTEYFSPCWPSGKMAINHLLKVCAQVELIDRGYA